MVLIDRVNDLERYFLDKGYRKYHRTPFECDAIVCNYQKRFDDNLGNRYFINIHKWDHSYMPENQRGDWWTQYRYEYSVQMYRKDTHDAVDFDFHSSWTLEQVEEFMEKLFETNLFEHYEVWE